MSGAVTVALLVAAAVLVATGGRPAGPPVPPGRPTGPSGQGCRDGSGSLGPRSGATGDGVAPARRGQAEGTFDVEQVARLAERLAALVRAGLPARRVWTLLAGADADAVGVHQLCRTVRDVVDRGGTQGDGLRAACPAPGPVHWLALACDVSDATGAPLAVVVDGIVTTLRDEQEGARERVGALAGPRATAAVLTWLPLAGLGLGVLTGGRAVLSLVTTGAGRVSLVVAVLLWAAGRVWIRLLLRRAESLC